MQSGDSAADMTPPDAFGSQAELSEAIQIPGAVQIPGARGGEAGSAAASMAGLLTLGGAVSGGALLL